MKESNYSQRESKYIWIIYEIKLFQAGNQQKNIGIKIKVKNKCSDFSQ